MSTVLNDQSPGGLYSVLRARQLATQLDADETESCNEWALFAIEIDLTESGADAVDEVTSIVFEYLAVLRSNGDWMPVRIGRTQHTMNDERPIDRSFAMFFLVLESVSRTAPTVVPIQGQRESVQLRLDARRSDAALRAARLSRRAERAQQSLAH